MSYYLVLNYLINTPKQKTQNKNFQTKKNYKINKIIRLFLQKKIYTKYELERFAVMCNAQLEHDDEMDKYAEHTAPNDNAKI